MIFIADEKNKMCNNRNRTPTKSPSSLLVNWFVTDKQANGKVIGLNVTWFQQGRLQWATLE